MEGTLTPETPVVVTPKPWWTSVTVWVNVIGLLIMFLTGILEMEFLDTIPHVNAWIAALLAFLNLVLRIMKTVGPLTVMGSVVTPLTSAKVKTETGKQVN